MLVARKHRGLVLIPAVIALLAFGLMRDVAHGDNLPGYMNIISPAGQRPVAARPLARQDVLGLDRAMMGTYRSALQKFKQNLRDETPIILALFTGGGGRFILYRPGEEPLEAPPVPIEYQLAKSCGHSAMAVYQLVAPYLSDPQDKSWRGPIEVSLLQNRAALAQLKKLNISQEDRVMLSGILQNNIRFMEQCLESGTFTFEELQEFAHRFTKNYGERLIWTAADKQVTHWMNVLNQWKSLLGADWDRTYAATNTIYVTRQNNILFTILSQYMGQDAINDRLLLFETTSFTTTPDQMLDLLTRIVADRSMGKVFFDDYYLMDYELLGGQARKAITQQAAKHGIQAELPPLVPFNCHDWPWRTNLSKGQGPATLETVVKQRFQDQPARQVITSESTNSAN